MPTRTGRKPKPYSQAVRVLHLADHLASRRSLAHLSELAEQLNISERQLRRDVSCLEAAGHEVEWGMIQGRSAIRLLSPRRTGVQLTLRERYTLLAVRRVFEVLRDTPFQEDVRSIFDKIVASLPNDAREDVELLGDRFVYVPDGGTKLYDGKEDVLDGLLTGAIRRGRVSARYRSPSGRVTAGELEPFAMALYRHGLYVVGRFVGREVRTYAAERFTEATFQKNAPFEVPAEFSVDDWFEGSFGVFTGGPAESIVVDFAPEVAHLIRARTWHRSQRITRRRGSGVRLKLDVAVTPQLVQWLVGWGPWVQTISPKPLADRVAEEHRQALSQTVERG